MAALTSAPTPLLPHKIGDALEVLIDHLTLDGLSREEADALAILKGQLAEVRKVKQRERSAQPE